MAQDDGNPQEIIETTLEPEGSQNRTSIKLVLWSFLPPVGYAVFSSQFQTFVPACLRYVVGAIGSGCSGQGEGYGSGAPFSLFPT